MSVAPGLGPLPDDLRGRRAVVTGAANGIGLAIARHLAAAGVEVTAVDRDKAQLERLAAEAYDGAIVPRDSELWVSDHPELLARELTEDSPIEIVVNNVGISTPNRFLTLDERSLREVVDVNLLGPLLFTRQLVQALLARQDEDRHDGGQPRSGAVLFISSLHDTVPVGRPPYSASKAAVVMAARELAVELGPHCIRVNTLSPGWVRTDPSPGSYRQRRKLDRLLPLIPVRRPGRPDDVARLALILLSDAWSGYVTGVNLRVDGGLALHTWDPFDDDSPIAR